MLASRDCGNSSRLEGPVIDTQTALRIASISPTARALLLGLVGLLLVVLGVLIAMAVTVRRRSKGSRRQSGLGGSRDAIRAAVRAQPSDPLPRRRPRTESAGGMMAVALAEERNACPTCGQEYDAALSFCPADARALVPLSEVAAKAKEGSAACVACHRAFELGVRYCSYDASELVPIAVYEATRGKVGHLAPVGVLGRVCSQCRRPFDLAARFCPHDGTELSLLH